MATITISSKAGSGDGHVQVLVRLVERLGQYSAYQQPRNDIGSLSDPHAYLASRFIDRYISSALALLRLAQGSALQFETIEGLRSSSPVVASAVAESTCQLLASVLRPAIEMFVELRVLQKCQQSHDLGELCRWTIVKHTASDYELKQAACQEIYDCDPSVFQVMTASYRRAMDPIRKQLKADGLKLFGKQNSKFVDVFRAGDDFDQLLLGGDLFLARANLSYKLHFLPQAVHEPEHHVGLFLGWALALVTGLGSALLDFAGQPVPAEVEAWKAATLSHAGAAQASNPACPAVGNVLFFDWGVAVVTDVERRRGPGNEVLSISHRIAFLEGLSTDDRIPRRFTKHVLKSSAYDAALAVALQDHGCSSADELSQKAIADPTVRWKLYELFHSCRA